jgi:hypothetical protein
MAVPPARSTSALPHCLASAAPRGSAQPLCGGCVAAPCYLLPLAARPPTPLSGCCVLPPPVPAPQDEHIFLRQHGSTQASDLARISALRLIRRPPPPAAAPCLARGLAPQPQQCLKLVAAPSANAGVVCSCTAATAAATARARRHPAALEDRRERHLRYPPRALPPRPPRLATAASSLSACGHRRALAHGSILLRTPPSRGRGVQRRAPGPFSCAAK